MKDTLPRNNIENEGKGKNWNDDKENEIGKVRKNDSGDDTSKKKIMKNQASSNNIKLLRRMLKKVKKSIKKSKGKPKAKKKDKSKQEDKVKQVIHNKNGTTSEKVQRPLKDDKHKKNANQNKKLRRVNKHLKKHLNALDTNGQRNLRDDKDEKKVKKKKKLRPINIQLKKRLNALDDSGKEKPLPKIRKIESPTQIIIKERMNYVKDKGWKVNVLKVRKTNKLANKRVKVKDYTIACTGTEPKCKISTKQAQHKNTRTVRPSKILKKTKITRRIKDKGLPQNSYKKTQVLGNAGRKITSVITTKKVLTKVHCQPRKIKYVNGKGWLFKVPHDCEKLNSKKRSKEKPT